MLITFGTCGIKLVDKNDFGTKHVHPSASQHGIVDLHQRRSGLQTRNGEHLSCAEMRTISARVRRWISSSSSAEAGGWVRLLGCVEVSTVVVRTTHSASRGGSGRCGLGIELVEAGTVAEQCTACDTVRTQIESHKLLFVLIRPVRARVVGVVGVLGDERGWVERCARVWARGKCVLLDSMPGSIDEGSGHHRDRVRCGPRMVVSTSRVVGSLVGDTQKQQYSWSSFREDFLRAGWPNVEDCRTNSVKLYACRVLAPS